jgi:L,D-transpeptidase catalytic domain/Sporulation and spore germination/Putative peptidoglycan binding domain
MSRTRSFITGSALALALVFPAASHAATLDVYLTRGEQLARVQRDVPRGAAVVSATLNALLEGPSAAERRAGYGTAIPTGSSLASARIDAKRRLAIVRFSGRFGSATKLPRTDEEYREIYGARLAQVVYTVSDLTGLDRVRIKVPGQRTRTLSRDDFDPSRFKLPESPEVKAPAPSDARAVQNSLVALTYLPPDAVTGVYDYRTQQAVLAFQAWEGLTRDGVVGPQTAGRLGTASRPLPLARTRTRHLEIYRQRGVVLLVDHTRVVRAIHTSTGIGGDSPDLGTPPGRFRIYRKETRSWSVPYKTWLPFAAYWKGGWALHGYADVPARPASHGCARLPMPEAKFVFDFVSIGTPVRVI